MMRSRFVGITTLSTALLLALVGPAGAAVDASPWTVIPSPSPSTQANYLAGVEAISATDAWAVGAWYRNTYSTPGTLTEHWDGTSWKVIKSPNSTQGYNEMRDVSAVSSTDVWAVGYHNQSSYASEKTMAMHWNGSAWSIVPTANIGRNANELFGVAAVSANDVWAVGFGGSVSNESGQAFIQHWDGVAWTRSPTPDIGRGFGVFYDVEAVSANDVWAVGSHDGATLIEHWDGSAWTVVTSPNGTRPDNALIGVAALGTNDVWAVGESEANLAGDSLVAHWDGSSWSVVPSVDGSKPFTSLSGVVAFGTSDVWAVGTTYDPITVSYRTFTEQWNGSTWTAMPSPNPSSEYDDLESVAGLPGGDVWAVGAADIDTLVLRATDA
jgi:hypothetical protein